MTHFKYKSIDQRGKRYSGTIQAANTLEVEHRLSAVQQDLITLKEFSPNTFRLGRKRLSRREIIDIVFQLEQLTKSGVPLIEGLKDLRDSADSTYLKDVISSIIENIEGGKTFSDTLKDFPNDFDSVFVALIGVGEETGELPKILKDMCNTLRWTDELIAATVKILMYPALVALVVLAVTSFLMIYLVPQIVPFVNEMGSTIPFHTKALINVSDFFVDYWWLIFSFPAVAFFCIKQSVKKNQNIKYHYDALKLKIPIFGPISYKIKVARFANYLALLYASGITVLDSLEICKQLVDNLKMSKAIDDAKNQIADGKTISESFSAVDVFPPLVIRMLNVGENTGNLDEALRNVRYFYDREVQESIDKLEPAINPILTVTMGLLLGWIMISVLGPVWDAVAAVG